MPALHVPNSSCVTAVLGGWCSHSMAEPGTSFLIDLAVHVSQSPSLTLFRTIYLSCPLHFTETPRCPNGHCGKHAREKSPAKPWHSSVEGETICRCLKRLCLITSCTHSDNSLSKNSPIFILINQSLPCGPLCELGSKKRVGPKLLLYF